MIEDMGKRLLYAEDEYTNRKIMEIQCRKAGVECVLADDGPGALALLLSETYDLVILDQYMPGMNGDVLLAEARSKGIDVPIIAITSDDAMSDHLKSCGFDHVYIKPLHMDDYRNIISRCL